MYIHIYIIYIYISYNSSCNKSLLSVFKRCMYTEDKFNPSLIASIFEFWAVMIPDLVLRRPLVSASLRLRSSLSSAQADASSSASSILSCLSSRSMARWSRFSWQAVLTEVISLHRQDVNVKGIRGKYLFFFFIFVPCTLKKMVSWWNV